MSERKDEKWLDDQLRRAVDGTTPTFDAESWKRKYAREFQTLLWREQPVGCAVHTNSRRHGGVHGTPYVLVGRLAVAAAIAVAVGLFVLSGDGPRPGEVIKPVGPALHAAPVRMMSMMSLRMAYEQGGFERLDQQLHDTLDEFRPRSSSVPIRELLSM